jgi:DNA-binding transcriptional LysR family regulator
MKHTQPQPQPEPEPEPRPADGAGAPQGLELRHLRYFVAVADAGSFTRAAERIFIAQPTLSEQIRRLEQIVGTPLLHRRREGLRLTTAGGVLLDASRNVLSLVDHEVSRTRQAAGLGRPRLRMVIPPGLPEDLAVKAAAALRPAPAAADPLRHRRRRDPAITGIPVPCRLISSPQQDRRNCRHVRPQDPLRRTTLPSKPPAPTTLARPPGRRPFPGTDPASAGPRRTHQRIRAGGIEAQLSASGRVLAPRRQIICSARGLGCAAPSCVVGTKRGWMARCRRPRAALRSRRLPLRGPAGGPG